MLKRFFLMLPAAAILLLAALLLRDPAACKEGAAQGLALCGEVIIPSLFAFTACVLFLFKSGVLSCLRFADFLTKRIFHLPADLFALVLFSMVGGYPIGAKLLNEATAEKRLSPENAGLLLGCTVNAGPAFILLAVGKGMLGSGKLGRVLLCSHLLAAFLLCLLIGFFLRPQTARPPKQSAPLSPADCFVEAVGGAASALLSICAYVLFFSTLIALIRKPARSIPALQTLSCFLEITCGLRLTRNLPFLSFLLGFAGISVWCQVFSIGKQIRIQIGYFAAMRCLHGALSAGITFLLLQLFHIPLAALAAPLSGAVTYDGPALSFALLMMVLIFLLSVVSSAGELITKKSAIHPIKHTGIADQTGSF